MARKKRKKKVNYSISDLINLGFMYFLGYLMAFVLIICIAPIIIFGYVLYYIIIYIINKKELVEKDIKAIDLMSGEEFEEYVAKVILPFFGYTNISTTKHSGDFGADILADCSKGRMAIQCKRFNGNVGVSAVQEVVSSKNYYGCNVGAVFTNSYFTNAARTLAKANNVILSDRNDLIEYLTKIEKKKDDKKKRFNEHIDKYKKKLVRIIDKVKNTFKNSNNE